MSELQSAFRKPVKVLLISSCDSLAEIASQWLFREDSGCEVVGIVCVNMTFRQKLKLLRSAIREDSLYYALYMQLEMIAAKYLLKNLRRAGEKFPDFSKLKRKAEMPILQSLNLTDQNTIGFVRSQAPDLVLSLRPGHIIRKKFIESVPPIYNLHCSNLPHHRGIGGVMQALSAGDTELGLTIHRVDSEAVDAGNIVVQRFVDVKGRCSVLCHTLQLYREASLLVAEFLNCWASNMVEETPNVGGSYNSWPGRAALIRLKERGYRMFYCRDFF